jgi:hypothetical protein
MAGQDLCINVPSAGVVFERLEEDGMERICGVPIGHVGLFLVAWKTPLDDKHEEAEVGFIRDLVGTVLTK